MLISLWDVENGAGSRYKKPSESLINIKWIYRDASSRVSKPMTHLWRLLTKKSGCALDRSSET